MKTIYKNNNLQVEYKGEIKCLAEWAHILNLPYGPLHYKIKRKGMTLNQIMEELI